jgi:hypothetical protein
VNLEPANNVAAAWLCGSSGRQLVCGASPARKGAVCHMLLPLPEVKTRAGTGNGQLFGYP